MKRKFLAKILVTSLVITAAPGIGINAGAEELSKMSQKIGEGYLSSTTSNRGDGDSGTSDITSGLIGYYDFEDSLANKITGGGAAKLHGGAGSDTNNTWANPVTGNEVYENGKYGKAFKFDGGDKGVAGNNGLELDIKMPKEFTISYWVNPNTVNSATSMVFSPVSAEEGLNIADNWFGKTFPTVRIWGSANEDTYLDNWINAADELCHQWSHITLTCSADGSFNLYVNGENKASGNNVAAAKDLENMPIFLGINYWDKTFDGLMDEVYIYNRALTATDVAELYKKIPSTPDNSPTPENPSTSKGYEIGTDGITINFHNKTTGIENWDTPRYLIYSADEPKIDAANYTLFATVRSDRWIEDDKPGKVGESKAETVTVSDEEWENFRNKNKEGIDYKVSAIRKENTVFMQIKAADILTYCAAVPVAEGKKSYVSLTESNCKISDISTSVYTEFEIPEELKSVAPDVIDPSDKSLNPFAGKDTSSGVEIEFDVEPTGQVNVLGTLFAITTSAGRMYFTPGSYFGYNANGKYFDANLKSYALVKDYIGNGGKVNIKITSTGFEVSVNGEKCYDQSILETENGSTDGANCADVLEFLKGNGKITFGTGSWWEDKANAKISNFVCKLANGTVTGEYYINNPLDLNPRQPLAPYPIILPTSEPLPTPDANEAESETLAGTAWWTGSQKGKDYVLNGDGTLELYVNYLKAAGTEPGAFSVELLSDGNKYITTGSDINIWTAEGALNQGETLSGATLGGVITEGHKYKVSVTRSGKDFTIVYFDTSDNKEHCTLTAKNTNLGNSVNVHVMAQVGTFRVSQGNISSQPAASTEPTAAPAASAEPTVTPSASAAPTTEPGTSPAPGNTSTPSDPGTTGTPSDPVNTSTPSEPSDTDEPTEPEEQEPEKPEKKTMKLSGIKAKTGTKKVTGTVSVKKATVKVKVGNKDYKKAKVNGKKFTFTASSKLKKGTKITIKITKTGYKTVTKTVKVK